MEDNDAQLQFKKRARRRLVGAVFFASVVAVVLPLVMDQDPRPPLQDVEIRIPGQDDKPFAPGFAAAPLDRAPPVEKGPPLEAAAPASSVRPAAEPPAVPPSARVVEAVRDEPEQPVAQKAAKPVEKAPEKTQEKPAEKPKATSDEARRAAAILAGQLPEARAPAKGGDFLVLIGAFSNEGNVRNLRSKLGEIGVKTFTEPLDTPQGRKTRLRAGPFASREAADAALKKMQRIGVSGVVSAR